MQNLEASTAAMFEARDRLEQQLTEEILAGNQVTLKPNQRLIYSMRFGMVTITITDDASRFGQRDGMINSDEEFDPQVHDGAHLIRQLIWYLEGLLEKDNDIPTEIKADIRVALGALEYITETIGLDFDDIFEKWRSVPITFMPAHISNKYGYNERGSLPDLLNDAIRAYICGAPAAAIAMCRAALEMVLKNHYGKGQWEDGAKLGEIIVLASQKFDFIHEGRLFRLTRDANKILHNYFKRDRMSDKDERTILEFLKTVKYLVQRAPSANRPEIRSDATAEWCRAEPRGLIRSGLATAMSAIPTRLGRYRAAADGVVHVSWQY